MNDLEAIRKVYGPSMYKNTVIPTRFRKLLLQINPLHNLIVRIQITRLESQPSRKLFGMCLYNVQFS